jgi:hypothetical protein
MEIDSAIPRPMPGEAHSFVAKPSRKLALFALVGFFAVFLTSVLFTPLDGQYFSVCGFKNFTGLPCPGCGLTHSFCALGKGELINAFAFNWLGPPLFLVMVLLWIRSACVLLNQTGVVQRLDRIAGRFNIVKAFAIGFVVYGIARIAYLIAYHPAAFRDSVLSHLITRLIG